MFTLKYDLRWTDFDANVHLGNSVYLECAADVRLKMLHANRIDMARMKKDGIGPIVLQEHINYYHEFTLGEQMLVTCEPMGFSEGGMFFAFKHRYFKPDGLHAATATAYGAWFDLRTRKLTDLPADWLSIMDTLEKNDDYRVLTKADYAHMRNDRKDLNAAEARRMFG